MYADGTKVGWPKEITDKLTRQMVHGRENYVFKERPKSLDELFRRTVAKYPDKVALIYEDQTLTYREWDRLVNNMAAALINDYGIKKGDRIGLLFKNCLECAISMFGIIRAGAIVVLLNNKMKSAEIKYQLENSGSIMLITEEENYGPTIAPIKDEIRCRLFVVLGEQMPGTIPFAKLVEKDVAELVSVPVDEEDTAWIIYTSGTTGQPKGSQSSHINGIHSAMVYANSYEITEEDRGIIAVPLFHVTGLFAQLMALIYAGGSSVIMPKMDAAEMIRLIGEKHCTHTLSVPTVYIMMMNHPDAKKYDLSHFRIGAMGGAAISAESIRQIIEWIPGIKVHNTYGLTEVSSPGTLTPDSSVNAATIGFPSVVSEVRSVNPETGEEMPPNMEGELWIKSVNVTKGYWEMPEATAQAITDGWLHTGDMVTIDEQGYVYIKDRLKDMINRGGEKIFSVEVEDVLYTNPKILEVAIVGVPDAKFGELTKAVVVPKEGVSLTEQEVKDWVMDRMAKFKTPTYVEFVKELPRNANGKVMKKELRYIPE
ncbi:MAG: acyl--CoA ligase [Syntrophomonadaceae bacterium]|nr:acyl--CoA ligase [Syntrophomonadaceae bacterium]